MGAVAEEIEQRDHTMVLDMRLGLILSTAYEACERRCTSQPLTCLGCMACDIKAEIEAAAGEWEVLW